MTDNIAEAQAVATIDRGATVTWLSGLTVSCQGVSAAMAAAASTLRQFGAKIEDGAEITGADVVLVDRIESVPAVAGIPAGGADVYLERVAQINRSVWVTLTPFGLEGDRRDAIGSELSVEASGGFLAHARFDDALPPTVTPGFLGLRMVGVAAAVAALHGLHRHRLTGRPVHADLSAQAVLIATGLALEMGHVLAECPGGGGSIRYGAPTGFFGCQDGHVYVCVLEQHQWDGFRKVLAPRLDDIRTLEEGRDRPDEVNGAMSEWVRDQFAADAERTLQLAGVPCTSVNSVSTFIERTHDSGRPSGFTPGHAPSLPAVVTEVPDKRVDERTNGPIPLTELRVLDAGNVLAVPLGAAWLGAMGAQVTKMEDPQRLDVYRRRGPFAEGEAGLNRSGYFNHINYSKRGLDVTVDENGSSLDISGYDVVIQNVTTRRAGQVGIDADSVIAHPTPKLSLTSSGFGRIGPWADFRAYGHNVHAFSGVTASTRNPRNEMADMGVPVADVLTSAALGVWVTAWALAPERDASTAVDISMAELMAAQLIDLDGVDIDEAYRTATAGGDVFVRLSGNNDLVAVSLRHQGDVDVLERLVQATLPTVTRRGQLVDLPVSDEAPSVAELDVRLRSAGVPSALVQTARELSEDAFLRSTGLLQPVSSPTLGDYRVVGLPWTFVGTGRDPVFAAPERP